MTLDRPPRSPAMLEGMPTASLPSTFNGFASPTFTQVPDELFDVLMPQISDAELRVLFYIIRRTFGFKRDADAIALSQMVAGITTKDGRVLDSGTGLSKATVARGLKALREKGVILAERNRSAARGDEPTTYRLRFRDADAATGADQPAVSHEQDTPRVSSARQAVSHLRDTQETGNKKQHFESSKGDHFGDTTVAEQGRKPDQNASFSDQTTSLSEVGSLATILSHRVRRDVSRDDRLAIATVVERFAAELGDQADPKASVSRALNLFQAAATSRDAFIDVLFRAKGETQDRRQHPGKAPLPRNRMAYFFAVVEDQLGLRAYPLNKEGRAV